MTTPDKLSEPEDIVIDFNEYLETVLTGLEQLKIGVEAIVHKIRTEIDKLATGTNSIINDMKKDIERGRTVIAEMLKSISSMKSPSSTISTTLLLAQQSHNLCKLLNVKSPI